MLLRTFILKSFTLIFLIIAIFGLFSANAEETMAPTQLLTIPQLVEAPIIDGKIGNVEWARAGKIPYMLLLRTWREPTQNTQVYVCYTDSALYVAFDCLEEKMPKVPSEPGERDSDIFHADCVEVFIQPEDGKLPYYHFGVGISGTMYDAKKITRAQTDSSWNADWRAGVSRRSDGWSAEIEIPFAIFGGVPKRGTYWRVNFTRESRTSGEFSSWSPVRAGFHEPESFGTLVFDAEVPIVNIRQFIASPNGVVERDGEVANPAAIPIEVSMETYLVEAPRKTTQGITLSIEPRSTQKFRLVDEFKNEGQLTAVLEAKIKGKPFYRLLRPYNVPPIRTRLAEISTRLRILESRLRKMPKDTPYRLVESIEVLKTHRDAVSKSAQLIPEATPGQLEGMSKSLDVLERNLAFIEFRAKLQEMRVALEPGREFVVWLADPWTQLKPHDIPKEVQQSPEIHSIAYRGEKVYAAVNITNLSDSTLDFRVVMGSFVGNIPANHIQIRTCAFVKEDAESKMLVGDALPLIDEAGRLTIPSAQTGQVFLVISTESLDAGDYSGFLSIKPLIGGPEQKVRISFTIYPLDLPADPKPWICTWGDIIKISWAQANPQAYLKDAVEHGVNVFLINPYSVAPTLDKEGNLVRPIDYTKHDELVAA